jgi:hypothetical protein
MLGRLLGRGGSRRDPAAIAAIKAAARKALAMGEDGAVTVSEIACPDPGCPDCETVILAMPKGGVTQAYKIRKPLSEVTEQDVREALVPVNEASQ